MHCKLLVLWRGREMQGNYIPGFKCKRVALTLVAHSVGWASRSPVGVLIGN